MEKKIKFSLLLNENYKRFLASLSQIKMPVKHALQLNKLVKKFGEELEIYESTLKQLNENYTLKDEEGKPVPSDDGKSFKLIPEKIEEYYKEYSDLISHQISFEGLPYSAIPTETNFSASEISFLESLFII